MDSVVLKLVIVVGWVETIVFRLVIVVGCVEMRVVEIVAVNCNHWRGHRGCPLDSP
jgi:hypothetical protein